MKKAMILMVVLLFAGSMAYAADGDLIVNGKVGVGTTTPQAKLHVAGSIKADTGPLVYQCPSIATYCATRCVGQLSSNSSCPHQFDDGVTGCVSMGNVACTPVGRLVLQ
jgi:hypothetical protein